MKTWIHDRQSGSRGPNDGALVARSVELDLKQVCARAFRVGGWGDIVRGTNGHR